MHSSRLGTVGTAITLSLVLMGCGGGDDSASGDVDTGALGATTPAVGDTSDTSGPTIEAGAAAVRVADIVGDPQRFVGQTVTVEADVEEVLTPYAFRLDEDSPAAGGIDNDLTVFSPQSAQLADIDDQWLNNKVRVTGIVRAMNIVDIEREIGWDLDPQIEVELEDTRPVLIARTVERIGGS